GGAGDGGLITTDDPQLAERLRRLRVHGDIGGYTHTDVGLNSRLDALQAAVLRVKLAHLEGWTKDRQQNADRYNELFGHYELLDAVELPTCLPDRRHVYNQYSIRVKDNQRDAVLHSLREQKIGAAIYYPRPLHIQECFQNLGYKQGDFPEAENAALQVLSLPIFSELTAKQQEVVVRGIATALGRNSKKGQSSALPRPKYLSVRGKRVA
ncbi:unnamed protein product, partial [marine sediment metagenome]